MALSAGTRLGPYEILEPLGAGGMGEVYRAHDEKLDRDIALKVLPEGALGNEEARKRFRKEAHALSRLSHPHIATILDFDTQGGTDYLAMELVRGHSLCDELDTRGPLPEKTVVRLGAQIAHGLQAAHEQGVIHRDLKPSNLQLTPDGLVKILDFGLARLVATGAGDSEATAPTETAVGRAAGTLPYMSPEQLRGRGVDARTDLYAVGAMLYELATGRRLFTKESAAELTEAILSEEPAPPRTLNSRLTPGLEAVILKTLDKDAELRYQTAKDLLVDLERLQQRPDSRSSGSGPVTAPAPVLVRRRKRRRFALASTGALLLVAGTTLWYFWPPQPPRVTNIRPLTGGLDTRANTTEGRLSWATDGVRLHYVAAKAGRTALHQIPVTGGESVARPLPFASRNAIWGYLSAESTLLMTGNDLIYADADEGTWPLWTVPVPAGAPSRVGDLFGWAAAASPDGRTLALGNATARTILIARRDGSVEREIGPLPTRGPDSIAWSPDGRRIRYTASGPGGPELWIWEVAIDGGEPRPLWPGAHGTWSGDGRYFLFQRPWSDEGPRNDLFAVREGRSLWARPAEPVRLTSGPLSFTAPGTSPDGRRLFAFGVSSRAEVLKWNAVSGRFEPYLSGVSASTVDASRDGDWLAWVSYPNGTLWRSRTDGTHRLRLTGRGWSAYLPRWSPDGQSIVFGASTPDNQRQNLYVVSHDGGTPRLVVNNETDDDTPWDPCWAPDASAIFFSYISRTHVGIRRVDLATREVTLWHGGERFHFPKCSVRGDLLVMQRPAADSSGRGGLRFGYWLFRADTGAWEPVLLHLGGFLNWSADGETVTGLRPDTKRLMRWAPATGGPADVLADASDIRLLNTFSVPWTGLAHDGSPLVIRDLSTRDLYALDWETP